MTATRLPQDIVLSMTIISYEKRTIKKSTGKLMGKSLEK